VEKAVILSRVSTYGQAENGTSLDGQEKFCVDFCQRQGWQVAGIFREDGVSGALYLSRDGLQAALEKIRTGEAKHFVTYAIDRSGRDVDNLRSIRREVCQADGRFWANGTEYPNTPTGDLMFTQFATFAEYERSVIRERTVNGRKRQAEAGKQPYRTFSPYGFHIVSKNDVLRGEYPAELLGTYQVVPERAKWAKEMAIRCAKGESLPKIQAWLFAEGVKTPDGLERWSFSTIRRTISHPAMKGKPVVGRTRRGVDETRKLRGMKRIDFAIPRPESEWITLTCEPLVSEEIWNECERRFSENRAKIGGNPKRRYKLGGLIACPKCKKIVGGSKQKTGRYYACPHERGCQWRWNANRAEEYVERGVRVAVQDTRLAEKAEQALKSRRRIAVRNDRPDELRRLISDIDKQERVAVDAQLEAMLNGRSTTVYESKLADLDARRKTLQAELTSLQTVRVAATTAPLTSSDMVAEVLRDVDEALTSPHLTDVEKNAIISEVVEKVEPNEDCTEAVITLRSFF
jgi:site-specific DNA recombinase